MPLSYTFWLHALDTVGAALLLFAYWLVSKNKIQGESRLYQWLNVVGSVVLAAYAFFLQAWSSMALNVIWALIGLSILGMVRRKRVPKPESNA